MVLVLAGSLLLVAAAMMTVTVDTPGEKAGGIGVAVFAVWLLSHGGARLYDVLIRR